MIEKLLDELYQLENKQAKGDKLCANLEAVEQKAKTFFEVYA